MNFRTLCCNIVSDYMPTYLNYAIASLNNIVKYLNPDSTDDTVTYLGKPALGLDKSKFVDLRIARTVTLKLTTKFT